MRSSLLMADPRDVLEARCERFGLDVCSLIRTFPHTDPGSNAKHQLSRAAPAVAANYRAARRSRSHAEFTARIGVVAEEADESLHWLEFAENSRVSGSADLPRLIKEADELTAIFSAMYATARRNKYRRKRQRQFPPTTTR